MRPMYAWTGIATVLLLAGNANLAQQPTNPAIDEIFADLTKPESPGCALGVYRDGKIIYAKGYGLANVEENVPISPQTVFDVGSISKQFTAASILLLERQGKLGLDDDVRKYIPDLPDYSRGGQKIAILHLLNHTSGLRDYVSLFLLAGIHYDNVTTDDDALGIIVRQKGLNFSPGSEWKYTGSGYLLLSLIVKRVSGKTLKDFATENIFQPLGMMHSQYRNDHTSLVPNRALAYEQSENGAFKLSVSYAEENGDGMVHTTIEDLQKWDENFYSGQVGGKDLLAELQERGKLNDGKTLKYAKGLFIRDYRGLPTIWHAGESAGYLAYLLRFPQQHFSIACLCNGPVSPFQRAHRLAQVYLGGLMKRGEVDFATAGPEANSPGSLTPEQLRAWSGNYRNSKNEDIWRITEKEGTLWLDFEGNRRQLRALSTTEFEPLRYIYEIRLKFEPAHNATPRKLVVSKETESPVTLNALEAPRPTTTELAAYGIIPSSELRPILADEFDLNGAPLIFHFTRDENSNVTGFVLQGFSERGMLFHTRGKNEIRPEASRFF